MQHVNRKQTWRRRTAVALKEWLLLGLGPSSVLCLGLLIASFFTLRLRHFLYWFLTFFSRFCSFYLQKNKWSISVFLVFLLLSLSRPLFSPLFSYFLLSFSLVFSFFLCSFFLHFSPSFAIFLLCFFAAPVRSLEGLMYSLNMSLFRKDSMH